MSNDSHLFHTRDELESAGFALQGNHFLRGDERYLPLYEAKMMHQFTHRWATYTDDGSTRDMTLDEVGDPSALPMPRYWVDAETIPLYDYLIAFRRVARTTDERTFISTILSRYAIGDSVFLILFNDYRLPISALTANLDCLAFDFVARQKLGGMNASFFYVQQFPVIPPHTYTSALLDFIVPRVLELTYTAWDLQPFAQDVGYHGAPFVWDEERRFLMRCELDALYFHLYQIPREDVSDDVGYIMETFPIVKRKDIASYGSYRTKDIILSMYDEMAGLPSMHVPAPKDEHSTYDVPDVSQWETWLNPPPASPDVAHPDERE